jgi:hypothetical protein
MTKFVDLRFVPIVKMLPGTKDFNGFEAAVPHALEPNRSQAVTDKEVGRQNELHLDCSLGVNGWCANEIVG